MTIVPVNVAANGRMSLPAAIRRALGLERGGVVLVELDDENGAVRLQTLSAAIEKAQSVARKVLGGDPDATVDALIAARRREAHDETA